MNADVRSRQLRRFLIAAATLVALWAAPAARADLVVSPEYSFFGATVGGTSSLDAKITSSCIAPTGQYCLLPDPAAINVSIEDQLLGSEYSQTNDCPATLPGDTVAGTSCTVHVTFAPTKAGDAYAILVPGTSTFPTNLKAGHLIGLALPELTLPPLSTFDTGPVKSRRKCAKPRKHRKGRRLARRCRHRQR